MLSVPQRRGDRQPERQTTESGGPRGYDAGKKVKGRKRHILTDTEGILVHVLIHTAVIQDREGAPLLLAEVVTRFPWRRHLFADGCYAGDKLRQALRRTGKWSVESITRSDAAKGFELLPLAKLKDWNQPIHRARGRIQKIFGTWKLKLRPTPDAMGRDRQSRLPTPPRRHRP